MADEGEGRPSRRQPSARKTVVKSALEELASIRKGGGKRAETFHVRIEDNVYDTVEEGEYARLVAKRREEGGEFVVDDDGIGYADIGEEDWQEFGSDEEAPRPEKKTKKPAGKPSAPRPSKKLNLPENFRGQTAIAGAFAAGAAGMKRKFAPTSGGDGTGIDVSDSALADILNAVAPDERDRQRVRRQRAASGAAPPNKAPSIFHTPAPSIPPPLAPSAKGADYSFRQTPLAPDTSCAEPARPPLLSSFNSAETPAVPKSGGNQVADMAPDSSGPMDTAPASSLDPSLMAATAGSMASSRETNSMADAGGLSAGVSAPVPKPAQPTKGAAGWKELCASEAGAGVAEPLEPISAEPGVSAAYDGITPADGGELALDTQGRLLFYCLDAYEEGFGAQPGTLFLFGKIAAPKGATGGAASSFQSCCMVVNNLMRDVYFLPTAGTLDGDGSVASLVARGPDARSELMKTLHALSRGLKDEVRALLLARGVQQMSMKPVRRSYAFERPEVPRGESWFLKVTYPARHGPLPLDLKGEHFDAVFGANASPLERFLVKRKLMGPCWLAVPNPSVIPTHARRSWCKMEVSVDNPKLVNVAPADATPATTPPLVVAALSTKTVINHKENVNEIAAVSVVYCRDVNVDVPAPKSEWNTPQRLQHFTAIRKLDGGTFPPGFAAELAKKNGTSRGMVLSQCGSERSLLCFLLAKLQQLDYDVLVGHNVAAWDLDILLHRMQACKVPHWSRLGRLKRQQMPKLTGGNNAFGGGASIGAMTVMAGRLICDTYLAAREFLKESSYTLSHLASSQLGQERTELTAADVPSKFASCEALMEMVSHCEGDAWLSLYLMFQLCVLPLTRQLTALSGNLWSKTLQGGKAHRIEYLLLHEFHSRKFLVPDKLTHKEKERSLRAAAAAAAGEDEEEEEPAEAPEGGGRRRKAAAYAGGLVLEPKVGLYDKYVVLLDFNSLYPSIIQEYNICFTTVQQSPPGTQGAPLPDLPAPSSDGPTGVLPQVLRRLVERRRQVKGLLKNERNPTKRQQLDIRQQAYKLTANSMYGCLGFSNSRFYAKQLAELVTSQGREILQNTVDLVQKNLNLEVIYGDTDSIMVHSGLDDISAVRGIGAAIKKEVNKLYKLLEIEMDGLFRTMLLLKKKKYAAMKVETGPDGSTNLVMEQKGLDIVRRDWSAISKQVGNYALKEILSGKPKEEVVESIHAHLRDVREKIDKGEYPLEAFVILKSLTKAPRDYTDAKSQPHVQVALRLKQSGRSEGTMAGDTVPYVICKNKGDADASNTPIAERAYHVDEVRASETLVIDAEYYLSQQIHPVVSRLCAPIEGTDAAHLSVSLGLDPTRFHQQAAQASSMREDAMLSTGASLDDDERFKTCDPLILRCPSCRQGFAFAGVRAVTGGQQDADSLLACPHCCGRRAAKDGGDAALQAGVVTAAMLANQVR
eukprot:jgi/Mesvir1/1943/Mv22962-RA.2